jgi:hypothetical protein
LQESPRLTRSALLIPDLRYLVGDCELARVTDARLSRPSRWRLHIGQLDINSACLSKLPASDPTPDRRAPSPNGNRCCPTAG